MARFLRAVIHGMTANLDLDQTPPGAVWSEICTAYSDHPTKYVEYLLECDVTCIDVFWFPPKFIYTVAYVNY